ncbi:MAG TPA: hypothetical protein VGG64_06895 [Pirellulales bacterium]|jgi:hypothetical protein
MRTVVTAKNPGKLAVFHLRSLHAQRKCAVAPEKKFAVIALAPARIMIEKTVAELRREEEKLFLPKR